VAVSRFDRRPPERDTTRINERIRVPEVRLIDENGEQVGIIPTADALERARERDLDLVEVGSSITRSTSTSRSRRRWPPASTSSR
jgi:translation initiation factor IF-3